MILINHHEEHEGHEVIKELKNYSFNVIIFLRVLSVSFFVNNIYNKFYVILKL